MKKLLTFGMAVILTLAPGMALATCVAGDLSGRYQLYLMGSGPDGVLGTITCPFRIRNSGAVDAANCVERNIEDGRFTSRLTSGSLTINSACKVTGKFRVKDAFETITLVVENAWLSKNDQVLSGIGRFSSTSVFQFTAIRK